MKKMNVAAKYGAGALGALALTLGATGIAGAQDADAEAETTDPVIAEDDADADRSARKEEREARRAERRASIAEILGTTVEDLTAAREEGQTLSDIAGGDIDGLVDYFVEQATARVEAAVENGRVTEEEAAERLEGIEERVTERIENADGSEREGRRGNRDATDS